MRAGIYALINLDGAPVEAGDARVLLLDHTAAPAIVRAVDAVQSDAVHVESGDQRITAFLGFLDDAAALAARLSLAPMPSLIALVRAALSRFGDEISREMPGEWSLLDWSPRGGVTLIGSIARRDPLLYARSGHRLAIAPSLELLSRLDWVGRDLDETGFLFAVGRDTLRRHVGEHTILKHVHALPDGTGVVFDLQGTRTITCEPFEPLTRFTGSFTEAMDEADALLRTIMRQRVARAPGVACLLSGGLDSSLTTWLAAEARGTGQNVAALCSAAPEGSGLRDELAFAAIVAQHLALHLEPVRPQVSHSAYRPGFDTFDMSNGPSLSVRHYLYDALYDAAEQLRLPIVIEGAYGEWTLSAPLLPGALTVRLRRFASRLLRRQRPDLDPFHVRVAPHRQAALPEPIVEALQRSRREGKTSSPRGLWGYQPGVRRTMRPATELRAGRIRTELPFRDPRLLRLFAGFPMHFAKHAGIDRAPVRQMLVGKLPDSIRLRPKGLAFSPDYNLRLKNDAPGGRARIPAFKAAEIGDWLDLEWLDLQLEGIAAQGPQDLTDAFRVQTTMLVAEYLSWWRTGSQ